MPIVNDAKSRAIVPGNALLVRQRKRDKLTSPFDHRPYTVIQKKGTMITAQRGDRNITRNSSHFKPVELETTVIVESDDDENIDTPTGTSYNTIQYNIVYFQHRTQLHHNSNFYPTLGWLERGWTEE